MFRLKDYLEKRKVYIIAEMSANHGGTIENALEIVRRSAEAGADCVKIQTYTADSLTIDCDNDYFRIKGGLWDGYRLYDLYTEAGTPYEWHEAIMQECRDCGVDFLSTPFSVRDTDFLEKLGVEAYKIASFEMTDIPLVEYVASKHKPMIISTGMATPEEIRETVDACRRSGNDSIVLLKCCSEYPAPWEDMHLANIPDMRDRFGVPVGLSDHSAGSLGAVVGAALGACVIEKHICLPGVESADSGFSMTIDEFSRMVRDVRDACRIADGPDYGLTPGEEKQKVFRRSIFTIADIDEGEEFSESNIGIIRPGFGLAPKHYNELIGRPSGRAYKRGEPITQI